MHRGVWGACADLAPTESRSNPQPIAACVQATGRRVDGGGSTTRQSSPSPSARLVTSATRRTHGGRSGRGLGARARGGRQAAGVVSVARQDRDGFGEEAVELAQKKRQAAPNTMNSPQKKKV